MLVTALRAHRTRQDAEKAAADDLYDDAGYVSAGRTADPTTPGTSPTSGSVAAAWQVYR